MTQNAGETINQYLVQMAENLPLFNRFRLDAGSLKNLTVQEIHTVMLIGRMDAPRMSDLARRGHVTLGTMTVMINKLVKKGYVNRARDDKDRRVVRVALTARGRSADKMHMTYHKKFTDKILGALTESEQQQVVGLVEKIMAALVE